MKPKPKTVFFAFSRHHKVAAVLDPHFFYCWEMVQSALMVGLQIKEGVMADAIGRCQSLKDFHRKAAHSGVTVVP